MNASYKLSILNNVDKELLYSRKEHVKEFSVKNNCFYYWDGQTLYTYNMALWAIRTNSDKLIVYNMDQTTDLYMRYYDCIGSYHFEFEDLTNGQKYNSDNTKQFILFAERKDTLTVFIFNKPIFYVYGLYKNSYFDLDFEEFPFEVYTLAALFDNSYELYLLLKKTRSDICRKICAEKERRV